MASVAMRYSAIVSDSQGLAYTSEMHVLGRARLLFPCKVAWQRKTECLQTPIFRAGHNQEVSCL
jgi:hypothetical protein